MKLSELMEKIDVLTDEDRKKYLGALFKTFTILSQNTILKHQVDYPYISDDWDRFRQEQNEVYKRCIGLELSEIGDFARKGFGLEPLTLETEIG